jgi:hypothetical protein
MKKNSSPIGSRIISGIVRASTKNKIMRAIAKVRKSSIHKKSKRDKKRIIAEEH